MEQLSIYEQLCFCTTRIETEDSNRNKYSGTGFFFGLTVDDGIVPLLITNKHVVKGMEKGGIQNNHVMMLRGQPVYEQHEPVTWKRTFERWIFILTLM